MYKHTDWPSAGVCVIMYLVHWAVSAFLRYGGKFEMISISKLLQKPKLVFHDQLGYFSVYFFPTEKDKPAYIEIYKQSILSIKFVDNLTIYTQEQIQKEIKTSLDKKYQERLRKIKNKEEQDRRDSEFKEKDRVVKGYLDEWDGYLTTIGRRDEKIKSLIKK